jgi:fengycin family lipopeptide synthetase D
VRVTADQYTTILTTGREKQMQNPEWHSRETLVSRLRAASEGKAGICFIRSAEHEEFCSYRMLMLRASAIRARLRHLGVRPGDQVILQLEMVEDYLVAFWACLLGRYLAVPLACGPKQDQLTRVYQAWRRLPRPWFISTEPQIRRLDDLWRQLGEDRAGLHASALLVDDAATGTMPPSHDEDEPRPQDVAFIQFSSGSTGNPKGVVLTHAEILANCAAFIQRARVSTADTPLGWMPLTHDMGLIGTHLGSIVAGLSPILMPTSLFVRRPLLWLEKAHQHRATILSSPNFGLQYTLAAFRSAGRDVMWDLSQIRLIWNGAEPVSRATCEDFQREFARFGLPLHVIYPCYGLAEATVAATLQDPGEPVRSHRLRRASLAIGDRIYPALDGDAGVTFCECGYALPCCAVRIADASGDSLPAEHVGHILIRGSSVTQGYYADPDATAGAQRSPGWLDTGDLGFLTAAGRLVVTGRTKEMIILNGTNLYPHDFEGLIEKVDGVTAGQVAVCGVKLRNNNLARTALAAFVAYRHGIPKFRSVASAVRREVLEATGVRLDYVVPVRRLPRTTSGKVRRFELAAAFDEGLLDEAQADNALDHIAPATRIPPGDWLREATWSGPGVHSDQVLIGQNT